jgi:hypothetical protein
MIPLAALKDDRFRRVVSIMLAAFFVSFGRYLQIQPHFCAKSTGSGFGFFPKKS